MINKVALSLLLQLFIVPVVFADTQTDFSEANAKYQLGDFKTAAQRYEEIIASGRASEAVYYNLGNAYFRMGQKGKAVVSYQRALRIWPRDNDLWWNWGILKSTLADRIVAKERNFIERWISGLLRRVTMDEISLFLTGLLTVIALLSLTTLLSPSWRGPLGGLRTLTLLLLLVAGSAFIFKWTKVSQPRAAILDKEIYARYGPSEKETKAFLLHEGAVGRVTDRTSEWLFLSLENGEAGWVPKSSCEIV